MISLKTGVKVQGIRPELLLGIIVADQVYAENNTDLVLTSVDDGLHSSTSLHYSGCAVDLRTHNLPSQLIGRSIARTIKERLGVDFDVIHEGDHIHLEYQPRR